MCAKPLPVTTVITDTVTDIYAAPETTSTLSPYTVRNEFYCKAVGQGLWFYDRLEHSESGPTIYRYLLEQAKNSIGIWDPFLHEQDAQLFRNISADIDIRVLSFCDTTYIKPSHLSFKFSMAEMVKKNHFDLKIAVIDRRKLQDAGICSYGKSLPHDRFLFIDNRAFIVGSSLQYHSPENTVEDGTSVSTTMIYEIQNPQQCRFLLHEFESYWNPDSVKGGYTTVIFPTGA